MRIKQIETKNDRKYYIIDNGHVYGWVYQRGQNTFRQIYTYKTNYEYVDLCLEKDKKIVKHYSIHRLVAKYFINNYSENLVIDRIDNNPFNNNYNNLQCITQKENIQRSEKYTPIRNKIITEVYVNNIFVKRFDCFIWAREWASKKYNCSYEGLKRYLKNSKNNIKIVKV